jgi:hypothetical protein
MAVKLTTIVIDAADPTRIAAFWVAVLGWDATPDADGDIVLSDPGTSGVELLFIKVPEPKRLKNRLHLDLNPLETDQSAELDRLLSLGAVRVDIGQVDTSWVVLADPEGNEFCLLAERLDAPESSAVGGEAAVGVDA